jgi:beta-galactosidase/beta-glucuronidase
MAVPAADRSGVKTMRAAIPGWRAGAERVVCQGNPPPMKTPRALRVVRVLIVSVLAWGLTGFAAIPLPEHPRPDFERADWLNLNGEWAFQFDPETKGRPRVGPGRGFRSKRGSWFRFPGARGSRAWRTKGDIAWYRRTIQVPEEWRGKRVFVVVGASDWVTRGWLDGQPLGDHRGGYTPFEFELTPHVTWGQEQSLVFRVDDTPHPFKLEGKQGYGPAKGIWQTVYLEARPALHVQALRFTPEVDRRQVSVVAELNTAAPEAAELRLRFQTGGVPEAAVTVPRGAREVRLEVPIPQPHLWSLEDPFLYEVVASLKSPGGEDRVASYFGMRKISVEKLPGTEIPYVALNGQPVYLQMALDQSYHPDGYYTFPSDAFMRDEILRSKQIGLNGNRIHIKVEVPRKLYWADKLGLLIMADVPNAWGEPTPEARRETEFALRGMIARDFNHPSIFSWVVFNETWGLFTAQPDGKKVYLPETQEWVVSMYRLAKSLDPTRLVEDNSPCHHDHTETDLNTWHDYLPGYAWKDRLEQISRDTFPGSTWNFIGGRRQGAQADVQQRVRQRLGL